MILKFSGQHFSDSYDVILESVTIDTDKHNYQVFDDGRMVEVATSIKPKSPNKAYGYHSIRVQSNTFKTELLQNIEITEPMWKHEIIEEFNA